ncbi:MAG: hypothetical protein ACKO0M_16240, partial [Cyanobium sp.]
MKGQPLGRTLGTALQRTFRPLTTPGGRSAAWLLAAAGLGTLVLASDRLAERLYEAWRPRLERQVGRVMGRPLQLGRYQGLGPDGLHVGPSRFLPGPHDGSTVSARSLRLLLDPLGSWQRRQLVLDISLSDARADLRPNRQGQLWVLGSLPPGTEPPALELHIRLRKGLLALHGIGSGTEPLQLAVTGQVGILPRERRLDGRVRAWLPGMPGSVQLVGGGNWHTRLWQGDLESSQVSLAPLRRLLPRQVQLEGHADGRLRLGLDRGHVRCGGTLQLRAVRWRQRGLDGPFNAKRLPLTRGDDRLGISASPSRY